MIPGVTYKAYIDNIKQKTGKSPDDYKKMADERGLTEYSDLLKWLKTDCGLGHGHANAMILYIQNPALGKKKIAADARAEKSKKSR